MLTRSGDVIGVTAKTRISVEVAVKHCSTVTSPKFPHRYFLGVKHEPAGASGTGVCVGSKRGCDLLLGHFTQVDGAGQPSLWGSVDTVTFICLESLGVKAPMSVPSMSRTVAYCSGVGAEVGCLAVRWKDKLFLPPPACPIPQTFPRGVCLAGWENGS